ncbi:MAG: radical SAM protein [Candidatus Riflebacteria bacterium]|nr:radical SAM protein [Candidatus Riflebacteria bacterium]
MTDILSLKIRVSYGSAIKASLINAKQDVEPGVAYLLYDEGCLGRCSFCSRAHGNKKSEKLSRVLWPEFPLGQVVEALKKSDFGRICLQTAFNPAKEPVAEQIALELLKIGVPVSMTMTCSQTDFALNMLAAGLDHVGIGLDGASKETYELHKRRNWDKDTESLFRLLSKAPGKIEVHMIFGLGDSEETFARMVQSLHDKGAFVALFALTPVNESQVQPSLAPYRRMQLFRYLSEKKVLTFSDCRFENGKLVSFGISSEKILREADNGDAFRTSGCKMCNRPFYNERPGGLMFNFPRPLSEEEFSLALKETSKL